MWAERIRRVPAYVEVPELSRKVDPTSRLPRTIVVGFVLVFHGKPSHAQWPQWGGSNRDFAVDAKGLADSWPSDGPKKLWSRPLGAGNSSIIVDDGRLYTMYRSGDDEIVIALSAADGKTVWERKYAAPIPKGMNAANSKGPHATPVISGDFIYTFGVGGQLHCLRKKDGAIVWAKNFLRPIARDCRNGLSAGHGGIVPRS